MQYNKVPRKNPYFADFDIVTLERLDKNFAILRKQAKQIRRFYIN